MVTAVFGAVLVGAAMAIPALSEPTFRSLAAALIIGFLGVEAIVSAYRGRLSLLSRIGPLP